jgi:hypothetical protein
LDLIEVLPPGLYEILRPAGDFHESLRGSTHEWSS